MILRNLTKWLFYFTVGLAFLVSTGSALLLHPYFQRKMAQALASKLSAIAGTPIRIRAAWLSPNGTLHLKNLLVEDSAGLPVIDAARLSVKLSSLSPLGNRLVLGNIELENANVQVVKYYGDSSISLVKILRKFIPPDTTPFGIGKKHLIVKRLKIESSHFTYQNGNKCGSKPEGMDYHFIEVSQIEGLIRNYHFTGDSMQFTIDRLAGKERSGIEIKDMHAAVELTPRRMTAKGLYARTPFSELDLDLEFTCNDWIDWEYFVDRMHMVAEVRKGKLNLRDLGPFYAPLYTMDQEIRFNGKAEGTVPMLTARNLSLETGNATRLQGNLTLIGLPEPEETYMRIKARTLTINYNDLCTFMLPGGKMLCQTIEVPQQLKSLGYLNAKGDFTGFYNDFVANATFSTALGRIYTDLRLNTDSLNRLSYSGNLRSEQFYLGKIINLPDAIGRISLSGSINGKGTDPKTLSAELNLKVPAIEIGGYTYTQSSISGMIQDATFSGQLSVKDPNLKLDFDGSIDFSKPLMEFNFDATVEHAYLQRLKLIDRNDSLCHLSMSVNANFLASNLFDLEGYLSISKLKYTEKGTDYFPGKVILTTLAQPDGTRTLSLLSGMVDADIKGRYTLATLGPSLNTFLENFIVAFRNKGELSPVPSDQDFDYSLKIKNLDILSDLFFPWLRISDNASIGGHFDAQQNSLNLKARADTISIYGLKLKKFYIDGQTHNHKLGIQTGSAEVLLWPSQSQAEVYRVDSLALGLELHTDSLHYLLTWGKKKEPAYSGLIKGFGSFSDYPLMNFSINQGAFRIADSLYRILPGNAILLKPGNITEVKAFEINGSSERLAVDGILSPDSTHTLTAHFEQVDLSHLNFLLSSVNSQLSGKLNGKLVVRNFRGKPFIESKLTASDITFNSNHFGDLRMDNQYIAAEEELKIDAEALYIDKKANYKPIALKGSYFPFRKENNFDLKLSTENFNLNALQPAIREVFPMLRGSLSTNLQLKGSPSKPELSGVVRLIRTEFRVAFINTSYSLTDEIRITPTAFLINNLAINDSLGNRAICQGRIEHRFLRDFTFDLKIKPEKFLIFNNDPLQNPLFSGSGFVSGLIGIAGPLRNLSVNIAATTERGTDVYLPLASTVDVQQAEFISFRQPEESVAEKKQNKNTVDLKGFTLVADLNLTPQARLRISLPQNAGTIESQGEGNISLGISNRGDLSLTGDYNIQSGTFLFNLQNILSRVLEIEKGSRIHFPGNPMDAEIDLSASFTTRTTLTGLGLDLDSSITSIRMPVKTIIRLRNKLLDPRISFSIMFPKIDEDIRRMVYTRLDTTNEVVMTQQFVSLLVVNSFSFTVTNKSLSNSIGISSFQMISNQISNLLSQVSRDLDIGINYRPGDAISAQELELALRTQLFDERVIIDGSLGMIGDPSRQQTSNFVGDINVEVKLTADGKIRMKAFNRSNNMELLTVSAPYTQGIGLSYRKDFDSLSELFRRKRKIMQSQEALKPEETDAQSVQTDKM
ncbi:MAG: translocation/assembly module TamB domain-containing protein [Bacteroidales bacterium]